jgi:threonine/homoserine/homoserine lactone efflux protein
MITELAHKLIAKYDNLPPKKKAFADIVGILVSTSIALGIVAVVAYHGTWVQFFIGCICYLIWSAISMLYKSRVQYYEFQEKYNK